MMAAFTMLIKRTQQQQEQQKRTASLKELMHNFFELGNDHHFKLF